MSHTCSHTSSQACSAHLYPLREVAGADGITRVHVPFSMTDLSQIEKDLAPSLMTQPSLLNNLNT
jgi:hypothetical protein